MKALYGTPSISSQTNLPADDVPGPGAYNLRSALGLQFESNRNSSRSASLVGKNLESRAKMWISKHHLQELRCRDSPAAGTYDPNLPKSINPVSFAKSLRPEPGNNCASDIGPIYDIPTGAIDKTRAVAFARSERFIEERIAARALTNVDPGTYNLPSAIDPKRQARSFGCSYRALDNVRTAGGHTSSGPASSQADFGKGVIARSFTRSTRMPEVPSPNPGPGAYSAQLSRRTPAVPKIVKPDVLRARLDFRNLKYHGRTMWGLN